MNFNLGSSMSLNKIKDSLRMMAKSEGGIGLDEGLINIDLIAQLIHFQLNENNGVVLRSSSSEASVVQRQNNLVTDQYMNYLIKQVRQTEIDEKNWKIKEKELAKGEAPVN